MMSEDDLEFEQSLTKLFVRWSIASSKAGYNPKDDNFKEINDDFLIKVLTKKLEWGGVNVVLPDYMLVLLASCAETPAQIQMFMVDILDVVLNNNDGKIPVGYIIKPTDFAEAFPEAFPSPHLYPAVARKYDAKWDEQKIKNRTSGTDNSYDTLEFWSKYKNV